MQQSNFPATYWTKVIAPKQAEFKDFTNWIISTNKVNAINTAKAGLATFLADAQKVSTAYLASKRTSFTSGNYGTVCLPYALTPVNATLYTIKSANADYVSLEEVGTAEAGVPYIFKGNGTSVEFDYQNGTALASEVTNENGLIGTFTEIPKIDQGNYVVSGQNFYLVNSDVKCGAYRAYIDGNKISSSNAKLSIVFDDTLTGINFVEEGAAESQKAFDLQGRRVNNMQRGLYIVNGKKILK